MFPKGAPGGDKRCSLDAGGLGSLRLRRKLSTRKRTETPCRDGQPPGFARGADVDEGGNGTAVEQRLYQLIRQPEPIVDRQFDIEFLDAGVGTFAFTFG